MIDAVDRIRRIERSVLRRERALALQDAIARTLIVGGIVSSAVVLYVRLRHAQTHYWYVIASVFAVVLAAFIWRLYSTRTSGREAAFKIDAALDLEDRLATAHTVIERGGPRLAVEMALVEDVASRVAGKPASSIVPYSFPRWHALGLVGVLALVVAVTVPEKSLPGGDALADARAEIQGAGEQLEQLATEAREMAPEGSATEELARKQSELGGELKRAAASRADALNKLALLEDRIRNRHDELSATRADEVVNLAERRLRAVVSAGLNNAKSKSSEAAAALKNEVGRGDRAAARNEDAKSESKDPANGSEAASGEKGRAAEKSKTASAEAEGGSQREKQVSFDRPQAGKPESDPSASGLKAQGPDPQESKSQDIEAGTGGPAAEDAAAKAPEQKEEPAKPSDEQGSGLKVPDLVADQAAKAMPGLSEELLKQAQQLRADELTPERIKQLQQAAQFLARDLSRIARSEEFQRALEQMARQVDPAQLEQVARELAKQESLKKELEAAGRLLMQNQEAREMIAGLSQRLGNMRERVRQRAANEARNREHMGAAPGDRTSVDEQGGKGQGRGSRVERGPRGERLNAQGRQVGPEGRLQRGNGGDYLYLQTSPEAGAARAVYSTAYPRYRREAEQSVGRSRVPPRLRSVVRSYFDAINPDARKQP